MFLSSKLAAGLAVVIAVGGAYTVGSLLEDGSLPPIGDPVVIQEERRTTEPEPVVTKHSPALGASDDGSTDSRDDERPDRRDDERPDRPGDDADDRRGDDNDDIDDVFPDPEPVDASPEPRSADDGADGDGDDDGDDSGGDDDDEDDDGNDDDD